jgi:DNA-binding transcriptional ArsR family regulator
MEKQAVLGALGALAQETRLDIFRMLVEQGPQGMTPGAIAGALDIPPATLSFHLKELKSAEIVRCEREGRSLSYSANFPRMQDLLRFLTDNCCRGSGCK